MKPHAGAMAIVLAAASAIQIVARAGADAWRPAPRPVRSTWCTEQIRFPSDAGAEPGRFELSDHSYLREPLDAIDDVEVRQIIVTGAPQIGKTSFLHSVILSQGEVDRAPMMFAGPDRVYIREQRDLIYALAEESPVLRTRIPPEQLRNDRSIDLERCLVYLAWSGSKQRLSGRSCKKVLLSELDRWRRSPKMAEQRVKAFRASSTVVYEGTPVGASPYIWALYHGSDRRRFHVPCPKCGHFQELRFFPHREGPNQGRGGVAGLRGKEGDWLSAEEARKAAYYVCEAKGCRIESADKPEMVHCGVWVPDGCSVDPKTKRLRGKPKNPGRRIGYQLNALYGPAVTFGDAAEEYLRSRDTTDGMESFFNDWLALPFKPRGKTPRWEELGRRLAGATPRGQVPPWAYFLTGGADVQEDRVYWIVRAWGDRCTSALVDWGELHKVARAGKATEIEEQLGSDLAQLDEAVLNRKWPVMGSNPVGFDHLAVCRFGIDSGYRPTEVYSYIRAHPGDRVVAVAGDPKISPGTLYRLQRLERHARTGRVYPEGTARWGIDTNAYKSDVTDRWAADRRQPGVWWLPADILVAGEDYLRQITNERRTQESKRGRKHTQWGVITEQIGNHYFDAEVYARALADQVIGQDWNAGNWPWIRPVDQTASEAAPEPAVAVRNLPQKDFSAR